MGISPMFGKDMAEPAMLREQKQPPFTLPLLAWVVPQLASLALSAGRVPLSAHPPTPIESLALVQLAIVQIVFAAMLSPMLFRSLGSCMAVLLSAAPMLQLAGFLASAPVAQTLALYLLLANWIVALGVICLALRERDRSFVSALATLWSLGGILLMYLHAEFTQSSPPPDLLFGPALLALRIIQSRFPSHAWMAVAAIPAASLVLSYLITKLRRSNPCKKGFVEGNGNFPDVHKA